MWALALLIAIASCTSSSTAPPTEVLAKDQTLSFPLRSDVADFDPAQVASAADVDILRNVFSGLYKFDDALKEVPDIAIGPPDITPDGITYTFHLRHDAKFSNGDPISAADFIYSWNRSAAKQGEYAPLFAPLVGYDDLVAGRTKTLSGLAQVDNYTFTSKLVKPAGYWYAEVALWPFWLVDQNVIAKAGDDKWFTSVDTLIGSGPFRMTAHVPGLTLDFEPVTPWYGGPTGALKHVHAEVIADPKVQATKYETGVYSLIGYGRQSLAPADAIRYSSDPAHELQLVPQATTFWIGFNLRTGPFAGDAGKAGRHAFSTSIDRAQLVDAVCSKGTSCIAATGGVIAPDLQGYLGDGTDPNAKFDLKAAKDEYIAWDPTGTKVRGLTYTFDADPFNQAVCDNLAAQWQKNLNVAVQCTSLDDRRDFFNTRNNKCGYPLFRNSWSADYDHPQNWFDYLFVSGAASSGSCYANPAVDALVHGADGKPLAEAIADYKQAGDTLVTDVAYGALVYGVQQYLVHTYVRGAGGNALYDFSWTNAKIIKH